MRPVKRHATRVLFRYEKLLLLVGYRLRAFARLLDLLYFRRVLSIKVAEEMFFRPTGFSVGPRSQVQTSTVEIDRVDEVLFVAKSSSGIFHPLNFGVDGFAGGVGNRMG